MKPLRVALLGLTGAGELYHSVLDEDQQFELFAVGDTEPETLKSIPESSSLRCYDDYRSLIVESAQSGLDAIIVSLEPFQSIEYLHLAAKYDVAVYHKSPFARNAEEARQVIKPFAEKNLLFVVSQFWPVEPRVARWGRWDNLLGYMYGASVQVQTTTSPAGWRGDSQQAGGGVLLNGAYEQVHFLIQRFGEPQSVFAHCCTSLPLGETRNYDTEDTATVVLDFGNDRCAGVTAWRRAQQDSTQVSLFGTTGLLQIRNNQIELTASDQQKRRKAKLESNPSIANELGAFATACRGDVCTSLSHGEQHIATLAAIEAAYLSAKTGSPESPQQFLIE